MSVPNAKELMSVLIVGSIAIDNIKTKLEQHKDLLGGSASYASVAASLLTRVNLVGIVGTDFPKQHIELFKSRGINVEGLQIADGRTFRFLPKACCKQTRAIDPQSLVA